MLHGLRDAEVDLFSFLKTNTVRQTITSLNIGTFYFPLPLESDASVTNAVSCVFSCFVGEPLAGRTAAGIPRGYWNFSWVAEDDLSIFSNSMPMSGELDIVSPP